MALFIVGLVVDILCLIATGVTGMVCWNWFIPTVFESAPHITLLASIGLVLVSSAFTSGSVQHSLSDFKNGVGTEFLNKIYHQFMTGVMRPISILLIAWIVHSVLF